MNTAKAGFLLFKNYGGKALRNRKAKAGTLSLSGVKNKI